MLISGSVGWIVCKSSQPKYSVDAIKMMNKMIEKYPEWGNYVISPEEFEKLQDDVAYMREASADESEEFIFGVAYGNYKAMKNHLDLDGEEAISKSAYAIKKFLEMYPEKNWGIHQMMADEIESWVVHNPEMFK